MYHSELLFVQLDRKSEMKKVKSVFKKFNFENPSDYDNIKINKHVHNGGWTLSNYDRRQFAIILTRHTSKELGLNYLLHEKRHVEDKILHMCGVDDLEAAAYLAGYIGEKLLTTKLN